MAVRIGELLLKEKRITAEQLQEALNYQRQNGGKLGFNLIKLGYVKDDEITALLSKQYGVPSIALGQFDVDATVVKLVPAETAQKSEEAARFGPVDAIPESGSSAGCPLCETNPLGDYSSVTLAALTVRSSATGAATACP